MLQIAQLKLRPDQGDEAIFAAVRRILHLRETDEFSFEIRRMSVDARKKPDIFYVYTLTVAMKNPAREKKILSRNKDLNVSAFSPVTYHIPGAGDSCRQPAEARMSSACREASGQAAAPAEAYRPVIIGTGPAGLFCGLALARAGLRPILIERGQSVDERTKSVERFWEGGSLDPESNVQFGEGGAGTFSDGKLNTGVKDPYGRIRFVLNTFVQAGADKDILYSYKPHVGTDLLKDAVAHIRDEITGRGGEVRFSEKLTKIRRKNGSPFEHPVWELETERRTARAAQGEEQLSGTFCHLETNRLKTYRLETNRLVLAIGHSSRDTFHMLMDGGFSMSPKSFAVGLRIQHPQGMIDDALYGAGCPYDMPPSPYKLTHRLQGGRGVYSFCMCPGGYVVNASSEPGMLAVNGMSYHGRASGNANSAIVVTVSPEEIRGYLSQMGKPEENPVLAGIEFQRRLERAAYLQGQGQIPVQTFGSYRESGELLKRQEMPALAAGPGMAQSIELQEKDSAFGRVRPVFKGGFRQANVRSILPGFVGDAIEEGILSWDRQIRGFADPSALLAGVESRTSSPVRIERDEQLEAVGFPGVYPCGEGAGYAGGITSAAVDGLRVAEAILAACGR